MPKLRPIIQGVLTVSILAVALYIVVNPASAADTQKWAQNAIALLVGFWLRGR